MKERTVKRPRPNKSSYTFKIVHLKTLSKMPWGFCICRLWASGVLRMICLQNCYPTRFYSCHVSIERERTISNIDYCCINFSSLSAFNHIYFSSSVSLHCLIYDGNLKMQLFNLFIYLKKGFYNVVSTGPELLWPNNPPASASWELGS